MVGMEVTQQAVAGLVEHVKVLLRVGAVGVGPVLLRLSRVRKAVLVVQAAMAFVQRLMVNLMAAMDISPVVAVVVPDMHPLLPLLVLAPTGSFSSSTRRLRKISRKSPHDHQTLCHTT